MENKDLDYIIEIKEISKAFPGVQALDKVSLSVKKGNVHALVGENGAGKSTLIKIINGTHEFDSGEIVFNGKKLHPHNQKHMLDMGVATIHQELNTELEMTIGENIFLGREPKTKLGNVDFAGMYKKTKELMDSFDLDYDPKIKLKELSISDMQLIEIVKAISRDATLVIMDEPTSSITDVETQILFKNVCKLRDKGVSIIYISHRLEEIFEICDEVTILRDGKEIETRDISEIDKDKIIEMMVGRKLTNVYPKKKVDIGEKVMEIRNLTKSKKFKDINFSLYKGEIVGFAGLVGAGRTELFRTIFGLDKYDSGEIFLNSEKIDINNVKEALNKSIIMTPEDRKIEGVVLCRSIRENISIANIKSYLKYGMIKFKKELSEVKRMVKDLNIKISSLDAECSSLSGETNRKSCLPNGC